LKDDLSKKNNVIKEFSEIAYELEEECLEIIGGDL
jgi:hypothetical protein